MKTFVSAICVFSLCSVSAFAADKKDDEPRKAIECFPAKSLVKLAKKREDLKPERRDTIDMFMRAAFTVDGDGPLPDRLFFKDGSTETPFTIAPDGKVPDIDRLGGFSKNGELCAQDEARAGMLKSEDGIGFSIDMDIRFKNQSGTYTIAEIADGVEDGKSHYKKMFGGPMALMVPSMTHISITYDDKNAPGTVTAFKDGAALDGLLVELFGKTRVIGLEHLQALGADTLKVGGGAHIIEPTPSIKKMKSLGFTSDDEEGEGE